MIQLYPVSRSNSFLSFPFSSWSPLLSNRSFFVILEATCSNCWRKQYATLDPTYIFQFTIISSSNIRKKSSPLQLVKSSNSQTNAVNHTLCNQCLHFLLKDIKSKDFAHSFPSFLWNLLVGKHTPTHPLLVHHTSIMLYTLVRTFGVWFHQLCALGGYTHWLKLTKTGVMPTEDKSPWHLLDHYLTITHLVCLTSWRM